MGVIGDLSAQLNDKIVKAQKEQTPENVWPAWTEKRRETEAIVHDAIQRAEEMCKIYAPGREPQSLEDAQQTLNALPQNVADLDRAHELVSNTIQWLNSNADMKQNKREANAKQMKKLFRKLDDKKTDLNELEGKLIFNN